jgi:Gpi18-like mannosyltransferase
VGDERLQLVFFPLYPLLMRMFSVLTGGDVFYGGLTVSLLCSAVSAGLLYDLAAGLYGEKAGWITVAYFLLSPLSVFLCCAYTEALFICLTLAAVVLLRRGHPWIAAVCGMLSALTRMPGVIVSGLFIIAAIGKFSKGKLRAKDAFACIAQVLVVFSGLFAYWLLNYVVTGDPMTYLIYQKENWFQEPGSFWGTTENTAYYFLTTMGDGDWLFTWGFQLLCIFYVYILLAAGQKKLPFDLAAYGFVYVAVVLAPTWLLSGPRYLYALAPLPMLQARIHKGAFMHALALTLSAVLLMIWVYGYVIAVEVL